jgi:hypothetical protein
LCGYNILQEGVFIIQLYIIARITVWRIVWVTKISCFMSATLFTYLTNNIEEFILISHINSQIKSCWNIRSQRAPLPESPTSVSLLTRGYEYEEIIRRNSPQFRRSNPFSKIFPKERRFQSVFCIDWAQDSTSDGQKFTALSGKHPWSKNFLRKKRDLILRASPVFSNLLFMTQAFAYDFWTFKKTQLQAAKNYDNSGC